MRKRRNVIVLCGGGSGGHLTPLLSVAHHLKKELPGYSLVFVGQRGDPLAKHIYEDPVFSSVHTVFAGKLRRYHGQGLRQLLDIPTQLKNIRDIFYTLIGLVQSIVLMYKLNPKVLFCKGGFVSVPVGLAAALHKVPFATHDSDVLPGLANRIIGRFAAIHAVALPAELYAYPLAKTVTVGVPVGAQFRPVTPAVTAAARKSLRIPSDAKVLFVIGGGLGAMRINHAILKAAKQLFTENKRLYILHVAGLASELDVREGYRQALSDEAFERVRVFGFTTDVARLSEAADVVVTRAGATNLAEFSLQGKACIIIPNPILTGGHQPKNAAVYEARDAAIVLPESDMNALAGQITELMNSSKRRMQLSQNITQFAAKDAALSVAHILIALAKK